VSKKKKKKNKKKKKKKKKTEKEFFFFWMMGVLWLQGMAGLAALASIAVPTAGAAGTACAARGVRLGAESMWPGWDSVGAANLTLTLGRSSLALAAGAGTGAACRPAAVLFDAGTGTAALGDVAATGHGGWTAPETPGETSQRRRQKREQLRSRSLRGVEAAAGSATMGLVRVSLASPSAHVVGIEGAAPADAEATLEFGAPGRSLRVCVQLSAAASAGTDPSARAENPFLAALGRAWNETAGMAVPGGNPIRTAVVASAQPLVPVPVTKFFAYTTVEDSAAASTVRDVNVIVFFFFFFFFFLVLLN
jgi:hypothetical protein